MVLLGVQISCELTNVTNLSPSCDDFRWYLKVKCGNCGENTHDYVYINSVEKTPIQDSRGDANLVIRCKFCKRVSNADIIPGSILPYSLDDSGHFKTIAKFDCRGLEFTEFSPRCGWSASSVNSDAVFDDISLTDEIWCDYDEKGKCEVSIQNFQSQIIKLKC
ncbi:unnamed protein product [Schistosoma guineensis]|nr:unnamed protein product [Schistosoma guineensis]CAH8608513.1 unnamed protein product [Schistosoma bovis]CAH8610189.1 unnamed protein product [Schistosoma curassoni]CAH8613590.1 unnamed protein product [Schistosoma bovis]